MWEQACIFHHPCAAQTAYKCASSWSVKMFLTSICIWFEGFFPTCYPCMCLLTYSWWSRNWRKQLQYNTKGFFNAQSIPKARFLGLLKGAAQQWTFLRSGGPWPLQSQCRLQGQGPWSFQKATSSKDSEKHVESIYNCSTFDCKSEMRHIGFSCPPGSEGCETRSRCHVTLGSCPKDSQNRSYTRTQTLFFSMQKIIGGGGGSASFSYDISKMFYFLKLLRHARQLSLFTTLLILSEPFSLDLMLNALVISRSRFPNYDMTNE